ncbi:MAG TPA: VWA domain-containing protein [Bryobacteraceae bacterium]|nr:VWA domain-containing protein [Bryobacteraceae bacterium]
MNRLPVATLLCGLCLAIPAATQQTESKGTQPPAAPPPPTAPPAKTQSGTVPSFTGGTQEIIVPVTVTDKTGRYLSNLKETDFRIEDEGLPQKITYFYHDSPGIRQRTVIGFLVDLSSGMHSQWEKFQDAIKQMIWGLMPYDPNYTGYLVGYSTTAEVKVDTTSDPDKLTDAVDRMKPGGGSALYNAIYKACTDRKLVPGEPYQPRRIIIVIGDGHDTASDYTLDQVIELAQKNLVTVFGVSTLSFGAAADESDNLERIARETGGHVEYPLLDPYGNTVSGYLSTPSDDGNYALHVGTGGYTAVIAAAINKSVMDLQGEISTQYILRYVPHIDPATAFKDKRRIKVDITSLPAGSVKVQARQYYYANTGLPSPVQ